MINKIKLCSILFFVLIGTGWGEEKPLSAGDKQYIAIEHNGETVYRWLNISAVKNYDKTGKLIHENSYSTHKWYEYDSKGNKISCSTESPGRHGGLYLKSERYEYNTNGYLVHKHEKASGNPDKKIDYHYYKDMNILYCTDSNGLIYAYDNKGSLLAKKRKNSNYGGRIIATFEDDGSVTMDRKDTNEFSEEYVYEYDDRGNLIYEECKTYGKISYIQLHKYDYVKNRIYSYRNSYGRGYVLESIHLIEYYADGKTLKKDIELSVNHEYQGLWYPLY